MDNEGDFAITNTIAVPPEAAAMSAARVELDSDTRDKAPVQGDETPDPKRPLFRELPPALPFPRDALGPLRQAAEAVHERTRAPVALAAQAVLAAVTLAIQVHADVELPGAGRRPLTALYATIAESGERKSACDRVALAAVHRFEEKLRQDYIGASTAHAADRTAWEAARDAAKKTGKGDRTAIRRLLDGLGPEPQPPSHPMLLIADPTPEALVLHLTGRPWGGLFTDEGGLLIGGHAMSDENRMRTGALLNTLWDGSPIRRLRVGTGATFLAGRRCSMHCMMQPGVASQFLGDATLGDIGVLARVLLVAPETTAGTRLFRETSDVVKQVLDDYDERLTVLLNRTPRVSTDDPSVLDPLPLTLDRDARAMWIEFHDQVEREMRPGGSLGAIRAFGSKMAEHAGRLAATMTMFGDPDAVEVAAPDMANGIVLARHYAEELLRLGQAAMVSPELRTAEKLLAWWQGRPDPRCHLVAIYQLGPVSLRAADPAKRAVAMLEAHAWVRKLPPGTVLDGRPRREAWELV